MATAKRMGVAATRSEGGRPRTRGAKEISLAMAFDYKRYVCRRVAVGLGVGMDYL